MGILSFIILFVRAWVYKALTKTLKAFAAEEGTKIIKDLS
jgi:hypothetical protein